MVDFKDALQEMNKLNQAAVDELRRANPDVICRPYLKNLIKCDTKVNNMVENI